ncbi:hypothetical protein R9X47_03165 [Wukongibacter baidiensis]|uniref:hypothetical protein n=1 Tax=Wukongibacter baidiensis TaxID=1723361 RepID=UPI003D7FCD51
MKTKLTNRNEVYDATYYFENTIVHVVAPGPKTPEEIDKILEEHHRVGWEIWKDIMKKEGNQ